MLNFSPLSSKLREVFEVTEDPPTPTQGQLAKKILTVLIFLTTRLLCLLMEIGQRNS